MPKNGPSNDKITLISDKNVNFLKSKPRRGEEEE